MSTNRINHPERLFPADPAVRGIASELYESVRSLPIVSPHGHTDPAWFALDEQFPDAVELLIKPDHYLVRMLYSQGLSLESLGIEALDCSGAEADSRGIWRLFARNYHLFAGTPSRIWLDHVFNEVFGQDELLSEAMSISITSTNAWDCPSSDREHCSIASISRSWQPPNRPWIHWNITGRSGTATGQAG
jgi:glucuronate isomerase